LTTIIFDGGDDGAPFSGAPIPPDHDAVQMPKPSIPDAAILLEALDAITHGIVVTDVDRRITFCNAAFSRIVGQAPETVIGRSLDRLGDVAADTRVSAALGIAASARTNITEFALHCAEGESSSFELSMRPVHDGARRLGNFIGVLRDISPIRNTESALISNAQRQCALLDHLDAGVVIHGPAGEIVFANAEATRLLSDPQAAVSGAPGVDAGPPLIAEDGSPIALADRPVARALATRSVVKNMLTGMQRTSASEPTWLMCSAHPSFDACGDLTEVVMTLTDVSELKSAQRALQLSDERLRLVLQGSSDAPWDWDLLTGSIYYSPRWWEMLGYAPDELATDSELWARLLHPEDRERTLAEFARVLGDTSTSYEIEFRLRHKAGDYVPLLSRGFVLRDVSGTAIRVSGTNTDLTERKAAEAQINQLAFYDPLTLLPNRRLLVEQLRKALSASARDHRGGALLFIDLDNFKMFNDTLGHDRGDQLLAQVALRLRTAVREADTVARLGGDEFVVMLEHLLPRPAEAAIEAEQIGKKILAALARPYVVAGQEHCTTASIGIALFNDGAQGVDGLLKQADLAMYQAKDMGRNTVRNFDGSMQTAVDERLALENDLRKGLALGELMLYYQPQVSARGEVTGAEVLLRWQHPVRGLVMPVAFIPVAEANGLIVTLGTWVLRTACAQLAAWQADHALCRLSLSVNVSVRQFREPDFADHVLDIIAQSGADPTKLRLEMTESLLAENIEDIVAKMSRLKLAGISFSLDDFGTGYSSLRYLQRLPLNELKIDRTFVTELLTNPNDSTIARAIISLAEELRLDVIAEGVENDGQRQFLYENGCRAYQGYLFGRPVPLDTFEATTRHAAVRSVTPRTPG
jgi:diguanylate cyclase (GGDEF)-like protein/PAS domain S-box-containing protein